MTERSESERAELPHWNDPGVQAIYKTLCDPVVEDGFKKQMYTDGGHWEGWVARNIASALRRLAAQDQKPVAWRSRSAIEPEWVYHDDKLEPHDWARKDEKFEEQPIYLSPPPAAGWEDAIEAALVELANMPMKDESHTSTLLDARKVIAALRHNAPPDSGAGELETELPPLTCDFAQALPGGKLDDSTYSKVEDALDKIEAPVQDASGKWLSLHERIAAIALPDHGGADAGVGAQIATLAQRFWTIHPRELQDKGMTREEFYIREMTALVASLSKPAPVAAIDPRWRTELDEIIGHLGAALIQSCDKDDRIIMDHVKSAHEIAKVIRRQA